MSSKQDSSKDKIVSQFKNVNQSYNLDPYMTFYKRQETGQRTAQSNNTSVNQFPKIVDSRSHSRKRLRLIKDQFNNQRLKTLKSQLTKEDEDLYKNSYLSSNVSSFKQAFKNYNKQVNSHLQSEWELQIIKNESQENNCKYLVGKSVDGRLSNWIVHNKQSNATIDRSSKLHDFMIRTRTQLQSKDSIGQSNNAPSNNTLKNNTLTDASQLSEAILQKSIDIVKNSQTPIVKIDNNHIKKHRVIIANNFDLKQTKINSLYESKERQKRIIADIINQSQTNSPSFKNNSNSTVTTTNNSKQTPQVKSTFDRKHKANQNNALAESIQSQLYHKEQSVVSQELQDSFYRYNRKVKESNQKKVETIQKLSNEQLFTKEQEMISAKFNQLMTFSLDQKLSQIQSELNKYQNTKQKNLMNSFDTRKSLSNYEHKVSNHHHRQGRGVRFNLEDDVIVFEEQDQFKE